jgi:hypothetical protein
MKKIKLNNSEIENILNGLKEIKENKIIANAMVMYYILKNIKILEEAIVSYLNIKTDLIKKYGKETENNTIQISSSVGDWNNYVKEITPIALDINELNIYTINISAIAENQMSLDNMITLEFMIIDDEQDGDK